MIDFLLGRPGYGVRHTLKILLPMLVGFVFPLFGNALAQETVRIGVLAYRGPSEASARWSATAAYLSNELPGHKFEIVPLTVDSTENAVADADIGFLLTNPGKFVDLASRFGIARIATLKSNRGEILGGGRIGAAIFVLAEREDLQSLSDLRGHTLAAVAPDSFDDFQVAWGEMHRQGIDPFTDLEALKFVGLPKDSVVRAVEAGNADAGVARSGLLEMMSDDGSLDLEKFRILNPRKEAGFPYQLSTRLYPEWALAALPQTSVDVSEAVVSALLRMPPESAAAVQGHYVGWTVPVSDKPVRDLMRELGIGPYADMGLRQSYLDWVLPVMGGAILLVVSFVLGGLHIRRRTAGAVLAAGVPEFEPEATSSPKRANAADGEDVSAIRLRFQSLTQREEEVLQRIVDGDSNKTIARQLDISPRTVEFHRANVMQKMNAKSLADLIRTSVIADLFQTDKV